MEILLLRLKGLGLKKQNRTKKKSTSSQDSFLNNNILILQKKIDILKIMITNNNFKQIHQLTLFDMILRHWAVWQIQFVTRGFYHRLLQLQQRSQAVLQLLSFLFLLFHQC